MSRVHKLTVLVSIWLFLYHVQCVSTRVREKVNGTIDGETTNLRHHHRHHVDVELPHRLETAPIPAVHDGPQPLKIETRSAPIALDNRYNTASKYVELDRVNRHISASNSPNPQRPTGWNGITAQLGKNINDGVSSSRFNHPGHTQMSNNYPINTYNHYNASQVYGSAYQYGSDQFFKGYRETPNIGVIPPKTVNAREYYNNISGFRNLPIIGQHSDQLAQSLYAHKKYLNHTYGYGYSGRDYVKNAYRNVLTGLAMWNIINGLTNGRRYTIYDHKSLPKNMSGNIIISNATITSCFQDATVLCGKHSEPLCVSNGTTYCVTSAVIGCPNEVPESICVNTTVPCSGCENVPPSYLRCAANITVVTDTSKAEDVNTSLDGEDVILCVTSLMVPINVEQVPCDKTSCSKSAAEDTGNNTESTTKVQ